jgi:beta-N-acetylhexosaminidase
MPINYSVLFSLKRVFACTLLVFCFVQNTIAQPANTTAAKPKLNTPSSRWVDSVYNSLNLEQKIGQLFMVAAYSGGEKYNRALMEKLIAENYLGGLIFMQGTPEAQAEQTNAYQKMSKVPLLIGMDAEWGLGMRLKGVDDFPRQIMMGAMRDSSLVYKMGAAVAAQCKRMGVHIDFAPVVDVNNNPNNPVINFRSFGENKYNVSKFAIQYVKGLQDNAIIASAKHFPGHGNTDVDSHKDLPTINSSATDLENLELFPFREMIKNNVGSMMIAHLQVPALDNTPNTPTTLSKKVVTDLLKNKMQYKGLIFTDALNMQGVAKYYAPGDIDVKAFSAGNDVLLFSQDVPSGVAKIKAALANKSISMDRLEESVRKILQAKYLVGLNKKVNISPVNITNDLNKLVSTIRTQVAKEALTLLTDQYNVLDKLSKPSGKKIAYVGVGIAKENVFSNALNSKGIIENYFLNETNANALIQKLKSYDAVVVGVHGIALYPGKSFGISEASVTAINNLAKANNTMTVLFGNPYAAKYFCNARGLLVAYDEKPETQLVAADIMGGNLKTKGKLPVSVCSNFKLGDGIAGLNNQLGVPDRFNPEVIRENKTISHAHNGTADNLHLPVIVNCCVNPSVVGANIAALNKIDNLLEDAIAKRVMPGCRVLVAKEGNIIYDKSFGYTTYAKNVRVQENTMYDIASVTKVASTTLAVMKLYDEGKINLEASINTYLPITNNTDKAWIKVKDLLTHQSGLKSWIPFYKETLDTLGNPRTDIYSKTANDKFNIKVANNLFMHSAWVDTMMKRILNSTLGAKRYEYSDLNFILLQKIVERISGVSLDAYVHKNFYQPLNLNKTMYNPLKKGENLANIAPTEVDNYFRYQTVHGQVHDMAAAMFGGVCGNAGLFSTAEDLSIIVQMLLNGGMYAGKRYFKKTTVDLFTSNHGNDRRGYGWDKPPFNVKNSNPAADECSAKTFGHQGFTGTCIWADPEYDLQFIFLSNRTFPTAENKALAKLNIRTKAQEYVYGALGIAARK